MIEGIILDLDMTLIDSSVAMTLRSQRKWSEVYSKIPEMKDYDGIAEFIKYLMDSSKKVAIVTSAPESYCKRILISKKWNIPITVCYHDTRAHKPDPEPIHKAVQLMGLHNKNILSVGDEPKDIVASRLAGVITGAALWGTLNEKELIATRPQHTFLSPNEIRTLIEGGKT